MWLSRKAAGRHEEETATAGSVTIGGDAPGVMTAGEIRGMGVWSPGGYVWRPAAGENVLVIKCGDGQRAVAGRETAAGPEGMKPGEVYIMAKGASLWLKNDGGIEISGNVNITGSLMLNGDEIT